MMISNKQIPVKSGFIRQAEKFEAQKMFSPSGFTALFTGKISVLYDKIEPVSIYNIQVNI